MANLSKERRDRMIEKLEELKQQHNDDASIAALNEIENALREKKFGLVFEEHNEAVDDMLRDNIPVLVADEERRLCKDENLPWNFIIEGDNLQALYLLEKTHRGKVDCIYIDPPYNTGARDWKYNNDYVDENDDYRHSKWLSMMKSRLAVAKRLLNPKDSVMIVTIDEKEYLHLGCLLEEMFPKANIQMITSVTNPKGSARKNMFSRAEEYLYFVFIGDGRVVHGFCDMLHAPQERPTRWASLLRSGTNSLRKDRPNLFYPVYFYSENGHFHSVGESLDLSTDKDSVPCPDGCFAVWPINSNGDEARWGLSQKAFLEKKESGYVKFGPWKHGDTNRTISHLQDGTISALLRGEIEVLGKDDDGGIITGQSSKTVSPLTVWSQSSHSASDFGSTLLNNIFVTARFSFPKSLYAVQDTLRFAVGNKPNALVVDFFAGSGTTMHAVNLLNAEDGGHRRCILVTNNEVSEAEKKDFESRGIQPGDEEWEAKGIAKYVTWPRTVCSINGVNINGEPLKGNYIGSDILISDGFKANVKYFKCDWTPRKPDDYLLSNALCLYIKELIELQTAQEVDGVKNVLILSKSDYKRIFENPDSAKAVEHVWVNENLIFNSAEMRVLREKNFRYIPREYFSQELKEVGEYV